MEETDSFTGAEQSGPRPYFTLNLRQRFIFNDFQIICILKVEPKMGSRFEVSPQTNCGIRCDGTPPMDNLTNTGCGDMKSHG